MAKMTTAQIMEKVAGLLDQLNSEGVKIAQYNIHGYTKNPKSLTAQEAKDLYFNLVENYIEDEVEWEEDDSVEMDLVTSSVENSLKKTNKAKMSEEEVANKLVSIMDKKSNNKDNKLKSTKTTPKQDSKVIPPVNTKKSNNKDSKEPVYDKAPTEDEIIELVGYRYAYPKFPLKFYSKALDGVQLVNREDIKTIAEFKKIEAELYDQNGKEDNFVIAVYVKEEDIIDSRMYDYLNMYPNKSFQDMLKPHGLEHFPQELDILRIVHISDKYIVAQSIYTDIPYMFTHNKFKNNDKLHCRANFMGLDFQIYQVQY